MYLIELEYKIKLTHVLEYTIQRLDEHLLRLRPEQTV